MSRVATLVALLLVGPAAPGAGPQEPGPTPSGDATLMLPTPAPSAVPDHEALILSALEHSPDADAIALRARALQFPAENGQSVVALVADLAAEAPSLRRDEGDDTTWTQDYTVLALVRDEAGRVVHKASGRYVISGAPEDLQDLEGRRILFERETVLPPGRYSVEVAVWDAHGGAMGVTRLPLEVPSTPDDRLRVSSLVVVGHGQPEAHGDPSPLLYDGVRLHPSLGDPVSLAAGKPLAFVFTLRPGARALASASVEVFREGKSMQQASVPLPSPDPSGQMRVVGGLPLTGLEPGSYVLRLRVNNAQGFESRSTPFTLVP